MFYHPSKPSLEKFLHAVPCKLAVLYNQLSIGHLTGNADPGTAFLGKRPKDISISL
jgi:hypothetical protein